MTRLLLIIGALFCCGKLMAQMPSNYRITYEKRINLANLYPNWRIDRRGKYYIDSFALTTNSLQATYFKIETGGGFEGHFATHMMFNQVFWDLKTKKNISQKEVSDGSFLLTDSIQKLKWKILPETRKIVGFECYKAMTKIQDSVDVVVFFTTQLQAPIGPERIGGLPGTILGMVIPAIHTTWLAKSYQNLDVKPIDQLYPPKQGKPIDQSSLLKTLKEAFKDYDQLNLLLIRALL